MHTQSQATPTPIDNGRNVTLRQALTLFETVGMPARNLSLRTRAEYRHDLNNLIEWLESQGISTLAAVSVLWYTGACSPVRLQWVGS